MVSNRLKHTLFATFAVCMIAAFGVVVEPASVQAQSRDSASAAAWEIRFQQLEKEVRRLTGQLEEQNYEIRRLRGELAKVTGDIDVRMNDLERGGVSTTSPELANSTYTTQPVAPRPIIAETQPTKISSPSPSKPTSSSFQYQPPSGGQSLGTINKPQNSGSVSSSDSAPRAYDYAYSFVKARDFNRAESEFARFMADHPDHPLVSNAKYWYGETFYVRGSYEKAARIFAEGYQQFPKGSKAASNLLKLGMALTGMGKTDDACIAFKQLKKDYSKASVPVLKRADTEMKRINCN